MKRINFKKKSTWIVIAAVVLVVCIAAAGAASGGVSAETARVSRGDMQQYVEDTAQVKSGETQTVYIEGAGKVVSIHKDVGDPVRKGDILLSLDKSELELKLKDAQAKVDASKAQLKGTEYENYANKIELARAAVNQAQVAYDSAKRNYENSKNLHDSGALSDNEFAAVTDAWKSAQSAVDTANLQLADLKKGTPDYVKAGYESQLEQADIYRDMVARSLEKQDVKAAIDGIVMERLAEADSLAAPGMIAFVIGNVDKLDAEADILEDDIASVKIGDGVELSGKPTGGEVLKGEVVKIAPVAKNMMSSLGVNQRRVTVTIKIDGGVSLLKPGFSLDARIITSVAKGVIMAPDTAVFDYEGGSKVFVVENGKAVLRAVKKGIESGSSIEIIEGLKEGETILVKPDNSIKEGARIKPLEKTGPA